MNPSEDHAKRRGFAVAGLGKMGIMHASMLGVVAGGKVAGLVDANSKRCDLVRSMGVDAPGFADLETCIAQTQPEGVWIATPQFTHRALLDLCLKHSIPAFCEKPLAHTLEDARAMAQAAAARPEVPVAVGFMLAHHPLFDRAATLLAQGAIGQVKSFKASCRLSQVFSPMKGWTFTKQRAGGGVLINSGCHLLYVLLKLFGAPRSVFVRGASVHNEVEDTLTAILEFQSGVFGSVEVTWSVPGHDLQTHDVEVTATGGLLAVGNDLMRVWLARRSADLPAGWSAWTRTEAAPRAPFSLSPDYCGDEFFLEDQDFVDAVHQRRAPRAGVAEALAVQELVDAMYRSMESGKQVALESSKEAADAHG